MLSSAAKGKQGEERAEEYLRGLGYVPVARNFRAYQGEVDLVMKDGNDLVFVEVKAWKNIPETDLEYSIDRRKQEKIISTAGVFMERNRNIREGCNIRFDVIFIDGCGKISHLKDVIGEF